MIQTFAEGKDQLTQHNENNDSHSFAFSVHFENIIRTKSCEENL